MAAGTVLSNLFLAGQQNKSIPPGTISPVYGSIVIPANTSFATTDVLELFQMPGPSSHIVSGYIHFPALDAGVGLTFSLTDTLATPTVIFTGNTVAQAGGVVVVMSAAALGKVGAAVAYPGGININLVPSHASTNTTGASALTIWFEFETAND